MNAQEILKLIETVEAADTAKLDEIEARVWCYLNRKTITEHFRLPPFFDDLRVRDEFGMVHHVESYTRSRDILKQIRPDGWFPYQCHQTQPYQDSWIFGLYNKDIGLLGEEVDSVFCKTEELAELHAIIQAIEFEREQL